MTKQVSAVLVGICGYGNEYVKRMLDAGERLNAHIAGVVDIQPQKCENYDRIDDEKIPVFTSIEDFYVQSHADLAIISTPIHYHAEHTQYALSHGSHVLCEKPMCATVQEARQVMETRDRMGKFVAIGFNWSFSPSTQQLKRDIQHGLFGKPERLKAMVLWPRNEHYYNRASWAGRLQSDAGDYILDSVANNATAHYLHHMFYVLGATEDTSARLREVTAELYRANPIENFDTCAVRATTEDDVEILFYATHAVKDLLGPQLIFEFEKATITYTHEKPYQIVARFHDGVEKVYANPGEDHLRKLPICIEAARLNHDNILCGPEAAFAHTLCINGMHDSVPEIPDFPEELVRREEETKITWVEGLGDTLKRCYDDWRLPSENDIPWARKGRTVSLLNYSHFKG